MALNVPPRNEQLSESAWGCLDHGVGRLSSFPGLLEKAIKLEIWKERQIRGGEIVNLKSLVELIIEKPPRGWGEELSKVVAVIRDKPEVLAMYRKAIKRHGNRYSLKHDNVMAVAQGNGRGYTLSRLKRDYPDLLAEERV